MNVPKWTAVLLMAGLTAAAGGAASVAQELPVRKLAAFTLSGGEQNVIPPGTPRLEFTPDEHVSFLRQGSGAYTLWAASGPYGTYAFSTPDLLHLTPLKTAGKAPAGVLTESGKGTTAYDADYAGAGTVLPAANGTDLLMFYHAENHFFGGKDYRTFPFYASVGLARSNDGGLTWKRVGAIITGADPQAPAQTAPGAGALTPTAIESDGFIYVLYREIDVQSGVSGLAIARAPLASDGAPGSWQKYNRGAFTSPGLGGATTPLKIVLDEFSRDLRQPHVSFNRYLNTFLMAITGNGGIYVLTSPDLITWSPGLLVLNAPIPDGSVTLGTSPFNWYPTIVSPDQASDRVSSQTGYLYYSKSTGANSQHVMYRQAFTITAN